MDSQTEDSLIKKRFVTEAELDERRKVRQEEWEKVRKPDDPEECPEEVYDPRSLYEKLQEQKEKKQSEFEEQFKFKNMVRGLDEDETNYLDEVSRQRLLLEKQRRDEDDKELTEYRSARTKLAANAESKKDTEKKMAAKPAENKNKFSQAKLLAGAVKRKRSQVANDSETKDNYASDKENYQDLYWHRLSTSSEVVKKQKVDHVEGSGQDDDVSCDQTHIFSTGMTIQHPSASVCVGILPGLGAYSGSSDSDAESSSDSDIIINTGGRIISSVFRSHPFPENP